MEKRAVVFVMLSVAILIGFQYFMAPSSEQPEGQGPAQVSGVSAPAQTTPESTGTKATSPRQYAASEGMSDSRFTLRENAVASDAVTSNREQFVKVETDLFSAVLSTRGGTLSSFHLKKYKNKEGMPLSVLEDRGIYRALSIGSDNDFALSNQLFSLQGNDLRLTSEGSEGSVSFIYETEEYRVKRTYTFRAGTYGFDLVDNVEGLPSYSITLGTDLGMNALEDRYAHIGPVVLIEADRKEFTPRKLKEAKSFTGNFKWIALEDKYFFSALIPQDQMARADVWKYQDVPAISFTARPGEHAFYVFVGPKRRYELMALNKGLEHIVDYGFFSVIAVPLFWLLKQLFAYTGNYGWSIVLLTIIIRIPFLPLVGKGQRSMKRMQLVQPKVKELREKYKKQPDKLNKEVMNLYKKYKVNPIGGCLPLVLQIPVFFALYKVLLFAIELRDAHWLLWILDLSSKDPYYVLPIVMGATMFLQQKLSPAAGDPKQQKIMQLMPIFFTFLFLNFPSGLVLYWLVNNILAIIQQYFINKSMSNEDLEAA
jgi:YidC/Oxa1 family membrane protein insertase